MRQGLGRRKLERSLKKTKMEKDQPSQLRVGLCFILECDDDAGTRGREHSKKKVER